jgi:hypothetical protein
MKLETEISFVRKTTSSLDRRGSRQTPNHCHLAANLIFRYILRKSLSIIYCMLPWISFVACRRIPG